MSVAEELAKLKKLRDDGTITDEQYERACAKLRFDAEDDYEAEPVEAEEVEPDERRPHRRRYRDDDSRLSPRASRKKTRETCMILHLSLFAGHVVPLGGIIAPIIIWQTQKDEMPEIDEHGKNAVNWIISSIIYALICIPLCFVIVGFVLLAVLAVLNIVFPIMAAVKANEGKLWDYPMTIRFLK